MALNVYIPVHQKDKNILKRVDNTNTELNRLKNLNSGQDLSPDYLDIYNANITAQSIDSLGSYDVQKPSSNKVNAQTEQELVEQNLGTTSGSTPNTGDPQNVAPQTNPLHDYAPYNYIITLSCLSKDQFNDAEQDSEGLIIARSGGKGTTGASPLDKDFYINNLVVRNTITPTAQAGIGTVYQVLFDVTEPYGVSFIDALIQAAQLQGYTNHLKAVYNLKIEFRGINDEGTPTNIIPQTTRNIPIHIYTVEMAIDAGTSVYQIQAVPATMLALTEVHGTTKEAYAIPGKTVEEVLTNFFDALNKTQAKLVEQGKVNAPDSYELSVDQSTEILKTKIGYDQLSDAKSIINYSNVKINPEKSATQRVINVPMGTNIQAFIEAVIRESDFYKSQFWDDMQPIYDDLKVGRVFTQLNLGEADDNGNNRPQYKFVYVIREQKVTAAYFAKDPNNLTEEIKPSKIYNYLYTGKNQDVLSFDITYKFGYYQAIPYVENNSNDEQTSNASGTKDEIAGNVSEQGAAGKGLSQTTTEPERSKYSGGMQLSVNKKNGEIGRIFEQIIADPSADLLVTSLEIIGDPYWIGQKNVTNKTFRESHVEGAPNTDEVGAVSMDDSEVLIELNFKTPTDLNDDTGLFFNNQRVTFSGKYKVYMCANRFADGVFTSELEMVRMRFQEDDVPEGVEPGPAIDMRTATIEESFTGEVGNRTNTTPFLSQKNPGLGVVTNNLTGETAYYNPQKNGYFLEQQFEDSQLDSTSQNVNKSSTRSAGTDKIVANDIDRWLTDSNRVYNFKSRLYEDMSNNTLKVRPGTGL